MTDTPYEVLETDVLVLGSGGAGLCAALHLTPTRLTPRTPSPAGEGAGG